MRVVVATSSTETATRAVTWAADLAARFDGELILLDTMLTSSADGGAAVARAEAALTTCSAVSPSGRARRPTRSGSTTRG